MCVCVGICLGWWFSVEAFFCLCVWGEAFISASSVIARCLSEPEFWFLQEKLRPLLLHFESGGKDNAMRFQVKEYV